MSTPIYVKRIGQQKYHLLVRVDGEYAYTECGQIHNMRHSDSMTTLETTDVCGICRARMAQRAA